MSFRDKTWNKAYTKKAERLWREQVKAYPEDPTVLGHAAFFVFTLLRKKDTEVIAWLEKAEALAPADPRWPQELGELYALWQYSKDKTKKGGRGTEIASLACYERAYSLLTEPHLEIKQPILLDDLNR